MKLKTSITLFLLSLMTLCLRGEDGVSVFDVLEKNCVECHNAHDQKGGVVLDRSPVEVDSLSLILEAVSGENPEMPPKRDPLDSTEVAALKRWIERDGGVIPEGKVLKDTRLANREWWSLQPLTRPEVPRTNRVGSPNQQGRFENWPQNEIDHFVLRKLNEMELAPSEAADSRVLIRRVTYDLTGLPPTPEEIEHFLVESRKDKRGAYRQLVERLLASPRYGEHWARHWLDVARYGESHGYDKDKARFNAWPYRDYVIRSFNDDKPWARFVQEQVAGDALFPGEPDGIVAMGFVAAGPWDFIAHTEVGEAKLDGRIAKHLDRDDMVSAIFNVFMSTTVQCAQCHNHKFDPVSMEDYYRLHAVFAGVDRADRIYDLDPEIVVKRRELETRLRELDIELKELNQEIVDEGGEKLKTIRKEVVELEKRVSAELKAVPEHGYHSATTRNQNESKWVQLALPEASNVSEIRLIGSHDNFAGIGAGFGFPERFKVEVANDSMFEKGVRLLADFTDQDFENPGVMPVKVPGTRVQFIRVTATKLAERKSDFIFALGEIQLIDEEGNNVASLAEVSAKDSIEAPSRWQKKNLIDGKFAAVGDPTLMKKLNAAKGSLSRILTAVETPERIRKRTEITEKLEATRKSLTELPAGKMVYSLATDFKAQSHFKSTGGVLRDVHLLSRGDVSSPEEKMQPGAPELWSAANFRIEGKDSDESRRAALARYLTDPGNPLLWRSAVNRIWLGHFGRGIVDSPNDFGRMGMKPTHPELLDWLAARFRDTQSLKGLHRLIVTSATYQQKSEIDPDKATIDGGNAFYWRMNRRKLRAEELRDSILQVAGVLDLKMGGPSFQDFEFKNDHTPKYWYHLHNPKDPDSHRRTVYRFIARSQTQPFLTTLDCSDPSQMVAKRDETTTSLQALALMNNPFVTAMSENLSMRVTNVREAFQLAVCREPDPQERKVLERYAEEHGLAAAARLIFNLNEFVYVD